MKKLIGLSFMLISMNSLAYDKKNTEDIFTKIYQSNFWGDRESVSGTGSNLHSTRIIRLEIPKLLLKYNIESLLDAPCGDFYWMREIISELSIKKYIGVDIVADLVKRNNEKYKNETISFLHLDLINDQLPAVDLVLCRDCILHFSHKDMLTALRNLKNSGAKYVLMTHFNGFQDRKFVDITTGDWRPINFTLAPFNFPAPLEVIVEGCTQYGFTDKCLGLWRLEDLPL